MRITLFAVALLCCNHVLALDLSEYIANQGDWMQVQSADNYETYCNDAVTRCDEATGRVIVINHTTGQRFENVLVKDDDVQRTFLVKNTCTLDGCRTECPSGSSITSVMCLAYEFLDFITLERIPTYLSIVDNAGFCSTDIAFDPSDTSVAVEIVTTAVCLRH